MLEERGFGSYIIIDHIKIPIKNTKQCTDTETLINLNKYINSFMRQNGKDLNYNKHGIANINVMGDWLNCTLITGTQVINKFENNQHASTELKFNIPAIPFCKAMDYFIRIEDDTNAFLIFDIIEFTEQFNFDNSHIDNPQSYYVVKVIVNNGYGNKNCVNYLRFMSKCIGLAY